MQRYYNILCRLANGGNPMVSPEKLFSQILEHINEVIAQKTDVGRNLWDFILRQYPADIATLLHKIEPEQQLQLFAKLPETFASEVFEKSLITIQVHLLSHMDADKTASILRKVHTDKLTDLFEELSDEDLKTYLKLLQKKQRSIIISHLNFAPKSAGRIMNSDVLTLERDFTIKKSINLLQRISPQKDLLRKIYVTDPENILQGYITIDELVLNKPDTILKTIVHKKVITIDAHIDQEKAAHLMHHYDLFSAPVIDQHGHFLGVLTADDVFDVLEEEASEDVYKMSGLAPVERSYFGTPLTTLISQRFWWLGSLLLLQSFSSFIVSSYESLIQQHVIITFFITMLIGTGGNAGNQSATLVIRGLATGEIKRGNGFFVLLRELGTAVVMASLLVIVSFLRVYFTYYNFMSALAISFSLFIIVIMSVALGTIVPLALERLNIDPAHSAAPFLATLTDIIGMLIYCIICSRILG